MVRLLRENLVPICATAIATLAFLAFVYGYPHVFPLIERYNPEQFERHILARIAADDMDGALRVAENAVKWNRFSPLAFAWYGELLYGCGRDGEAFDILNQGLALRIGEDYWETHDPFYAPKARLQRGLFWKDGYPFEMACDFELARPFMKEQIKTFDEYRSDLYSAYSQLDWWARALEFGAPSSEALEQAKPDELKLLARIAVGRGQWDFVGQTTAALLEQRPNDAEAEAWSGIATLNQGREGAGLAALKTAASHGSPEAAWTLGVALARAGDRPGAASALMTIPALSIYRPLALALVIRLLDEVQPPFDAALAARRPELAAELEALLAQPGALNPQPDDDPYRRFVLSKADPDSAYLWAGGPFPLVATWQDKRPRAADAPETQLVNYGGDRSVTCRWKERVIALHWVENRVSWPVADKIQGGETRLPGWTDVAREWWGIRTNSAVVLNRDRGGMLQADIVNDDLNKAALLYSGPIEVNYDVQYLLAGLMRAPTSHGTLSWVAENRHEEPLAEGAAFLGAQTPDWTWGATVVRPRVHWDRLTIHAGVSRHVGMASFRAILLTEIPEPSGQQ